MTVGSCDQIFQWNATKHWRMLQKTTNLAKIRAKRCWNLHHQLDRTMSPMYSDPNFFTNGLITGVIFCNIPNNFIWENNLIQNTTPLLPLNASSYPVKSEVNLDWKVMYVTGFSLSAHSNPKKIKTKLNLTKFIEKHIVLYL